MTTHKPVAPKALKRVEKLSSGTTIAVHQPADLRERVDEAAKEAAEEALTKAQRASKTFSSLDCRLLGRDRLFCVADRLLGLQSS